MITKHRDEEDTPSGASLEEAELRELMAVGMPPQSDAQKQRLLCEFAPLRSDTPERALERIDARHELAQTRAGRAREHKGSALMVKDRLVHREARPEVLVARPQFWFTRRPRVAYVAGAAGVILASFGSGLFGGKLASGGAEDGRSIEPAASTAAGVSPAMPKLPPGHVYSGQLGENGAIQLKAVFSSYLAEKVGSEVLDMVRLPAGSFEMGTPVTEHGRQEDEGPVHTVTFQTGFYIGRHEITRAVWREVARQPKVDIDLNPDPARHEGSLELPVENVSFWEATEFCKRLSKMTGRHYRLPTEAEWEYAVRAGTRTPFTFGETLSSAWVNYNCELPYGVETARGGNSPAAKCTKRDAPVPVGSLGVANGFGLFDMHGNVWEWVQDVHGAGYEAAPIDGSARSGPRGVDRIARGGGWRNSAVDIRSGARLSAKPGKPVDDIGFRVVAEL